MLSDSPSEPPTKPAPLQKASLYQTCRLVLNGLAAVPGFDQYISFDTNNTHDPLTKLWDICRQGSSLCLLFNTLRPETPIQFDPSVNKPKACVYYFIIACRDQLGFSQEGLFTVSDLFQDDTNGFVKVVTTVKRLLQLLEQNGIIEIRSTSNRDSDPKDTRDKVVYELLETERKYVQDLEKLQHYMREAHAQKVLPPDTLHQLFGNLNALVDFQRRLLIQAEDNADKPPREQRFGNMFIQLEEPFSVYEPFCANFQTAQDLVVQETPKLQKLSDILSPTYELPSMLIKPVQRVCKYPLLLQQLVKETPEDWPYYEEMKDGLEAIQRVASKVNETKRRQENIQLVEELRNRLEDDTWKNALSHFGPLLLHERFTITRKEIDHDVLMYLFQKSLFICKEDVTKKGMKRKKKAGVKENALTVKGCFMISQIAQVTDTSSNGSWSLRVYWSERDQKPYSMQSYNLKSFLIKCRNDEQLRQWESMLSKLVESEKRQSKVDKASTANSTTPSMSSEVKSVKQMVPRPPVTSNFFKSGSRVSYAEYEDDEETESDDEEDEEDDDDDDEPILSSTRRNSQPAYSRSSVENNNSERHMQQNSVQLTKKHSYNNMMIPGMTLPPLPRTGDESTPESVSSPPLSYPSSPLASFPSSPSTSTRASTSSAASANMLHRRQDNGLFPTEFIGRSLLGDSSNSTNTTNTTNEECPYPPYTARARSQSTPNIHHYAPTNDQQPPPPPPPLPISAKDNADVQQHIKVKLNYMDGVYVVVVPENIQYQELLERIERKIQFCGQDFNSSLGLKYQDEDGDLITVSSDEDVQMGFESRGSSNTVNFYVISAS